MKVKDLPRVPRPDRSGDWDFYDCMTFAAEMYELYPEIKKAIRSSNRRANKK